MICIRGFGNEEKARKYVFGTENRRSLFLSAPPIIPAWQYYLFAVGRMILR
jgi:hypothetical protein